VRGNPIIRSGETRGLFSQSFFLRTKPFTPKEKPKKEFDYLWNTKKKIRIRFWETPKKKLEWVLPAGLSPGHNFCTLCLGTEAGCLSAAAPVTGAAADEYNRDRC
jgi:hypothetical protein